jgi:predicted metal-dependent phosphotriesterase family hydrolase
MKEMTNKNSVKAMYVAPMVEMMNARVEKGFEGTEISIGIEPEGESGNSYNFD